jgi:hypothetical protein
MPARQTTVYTQPALGVAGDFASVNPRYTVLEGAGGAVAGPNGLTIGLAAWMASPLDSDGAPSVFNNFGSGNIAGIVPREQQGLFTQYLQGAGMLIPAGFECTVFSDADLLVTNNGATPAVPGQKVYATFANGQFTAAAAASPTGGGTSTASTIAAQTYSVTGSVLGNLMTVTAVGSGTIQPGSVPSITGLLSGTTVASQLTPLLSGEALGGVGRYYLSSDQPTIASGTITGTWGLLTVGGTVVAGYPVGGVLSGATGTITANASNGVSLTGVGGAGTYATQTQTVSSGAINVSAINVETSWFVRSYAPAGTLMKISRKTLG